MTAQAASPFAKIQALGRYVQQIQYVAIEANLARGGYQPHLASQVSDKQYGDCKDKANLLRALLKLAGIDSYLVAIYSGDRDFVHPEWVAPSQFNHMILAVKVPADVNTPAVLNDKSSGRLLIFDPNLHRHTRWTVARRRTEQLRGYFRRRCRRSAARRLHLFCPRPPPPAVGTMDCADRQSAELSGIEPKDDLAQGVFNLKLGFKATLANCP